MKTTFDIPEPLLREVQGLARQQGTTTKSLVERALRRLLDEQGSAEPFVLGDGSVGGQGLSPQFVGASWHEIRDAAYGLPRVIAVDTNVLVHAHRRDSPFHRQAHDAVGALAASPASWAIPWPCLHEFYAIATHRAIYRPPSSADAAVTQLRLWTGAPTVRLLSEPPGHLDAMAALLTEGDVTGPGVHDARIAALCLAHGVTELLTLDRDFDRFPGLRTRSLLAAAR